MKRWGRAGGGQGEGRGATDERTAEGAFLPHAHTYCVPVPLPPHFPGPLLFFLGFSQPLHTYTRTHTRPHTHTHTHTRARTHTHAHTRACVWRLCSVCSVLNTHVHVRTRTHTRARATRTRVAGSRRDAPPVGVVPEEGALGQRGAGHGAGNDPGVRVTGGARDLCVCCVCVVASVFINETKARPDDAGVTCECVCVCVCVIRCVYGCVCVCVRLGGCVCEIRGVCVCVSV